ncbi:LLM class flavin-dependent oxidoreductase [Paenibacillus periandrae]|uniref:LLM class flavin-dependent oxidoreductase n=1 Tax=Paenibacillus periandrae TaxID=1761741 RepID=UPI001F08B02C|nr:LLM class flavin-dependent oxidoreductase [Paenibacillus periandrae]
MARTMKLGLFWAAAGHHIAGWRHPSAEASANENLKFIQNMVKKAESGKFDLFFLGDALDSSAVAPPSDIVRFEPLTLLTAISTVTHHIGLIATASTTYSEPFHLARIFASLDHLSSGRAGWNIVTTSAARAALNFSQDVHLAHPQRYERAKEFVEVAKGLWDSWEEDTFIRNKATGQYLDTSKVHALEHKGKYFSVQGPLNVSRSPQGYPVLIQAGSSEDGQSFAADIAEIIFTAQNNLESAIEFYKSVKEKVRLAGRDPEAVKVMPGVVPIIGKTREEALSKYQKLQDLIHIEQALRIISAILGVDVSTFPLDELLPEFPETNGLKSRAQLVLNLARTKQLTVRELALEVAGSKGHHIMIGSAEEIADRLEEWFVQGGADGFNIMPPYFPGGIDDFVDLVVPILQSRGLFRTEYEGHTLRENLGLARPVNQFLGKQHA